MAVFPLRDTANGAMSTQPKSPPQQAAYPPASRHGVCKVCCGSACQKKALASLHDKMMDRYESVSIGCLFAYMIIFRKTAMLPHKKHRCEAEQPVHASQCTYRIVLPIHYIAQASMCKRRPQQQRPNTVPPRVCTIHKRHQHPIRCMPTEDEVVTPTKPPNC